MPLSRAVQRPTIPIAYLQLLLEILGERGVLPERLMQGLSVAPALLDQPQARMSEVQWAQLVLRALDLTGDPGLGYEYGLRMRPTLHGVLGYAALSSASLREAWQLSMRYFRSRQARFSLHSTEDAQRVQMELIESGTIPVARTFFIENILLGLARSTAVLLGRELDHLEDLEIWFDWPEPPYFAAWRNRLPRTRFDCPCNAVRLPQAWLDRRPVLADPLASRQAVALCERELALADDALDDVALQVRAVLSPGDAGGYPNLDTLAARLHLSGRSLKRRLQRQGTTFLQLLEEARERDARQLLAHSGLEIQAIAERLGYRNPANFARAFQRWTGQSPSTWRRAGGAVQE